MTSETPFRFLDLPAELRVSIYEIALKPRDRYHWEYIEGKGQTYNPPGILLANKQTYLEATPVFYRQSTFYIYDQNAWLWLAELNPQHRNALKRINRPVTAKFATSSTVMELLQQSGQDIEDLGIKLKEGVLFVWTDRQCCSTNGFGDCK